MAGPRRWAPLLLWASLVLAGAAGSGLEEQQAGPPDWAAPPQEPQAPFDYRASMPVITKRELAQAIKQAQASQPEWAPDGPDEDGQRWSAAGWLRPAVRLAEWQLNESGQAQVSAETSRLLAKRYQLTRLQVQRGLPLISLEQTSLGRQCSRPARSFTCAAGRYRSLSGHCNNVQNPDWGAASTALARWAPARYADHVGEPVGGPESAPGSPGSPLAVARALSPPAGSGAAFRAHQTALLGVLGQFVLHDLVLVSAGGGRRRCCAASGAPAECLALRGPAGHCLEYERSLLAPRPACSLGPRDQLNLASSYLDGSVIYGASEQQVRQLRSFQGGRLRSQQLADPRASQNLGLAMMHTIWLREHNRLADGLAQLNGHWRDERLFEEARRLLVAQLQQVAYTEWLPALLGAHQLARFNLSAQSQGYYQGYEPAQSAAFSNELAVLLFPFVLSSLPRQLQRYGHRLELLGTQAILAPRLDTELLLKRDNFSQLMMGLISQSAPEPSQSLTGWSSGAPNSTAAGPAQPEEEPDGTDAAGQKERDGSVGWQLMALSLQQARDHGLQGYLYWRQACQLAPQIRTWQQLAEVLEPEQAAERLRQAYGGQLEQLELQVALLERPMAGASVGPTLACLLGRQFLQLKQADRFWYENDLPPSAFSPQQLDQIRQSNLARLICRNAQQSGLTFVQPEPLLASDPFLNAYQYCSNGALGPALDLEPWREQVSSAQQVDQERMMASLASQLALSVARAEHQLERLTRRQRQLSRKRRLAISSQLEDEDSWSPASSREAQPRPSHRALAGQHALARPERWRAQSQRLANQSLILELATSDVVRELLRQGKDRERAQSMQGDIRDFLQSLEAVQLDNLVENAGAHSHLARLLDQLSQQHLAGLSGGAKPAQTEQELLPAADQCGDQQRIFPCDHTSPYRTSTGWCNNLRQPHLGQSFAIHDRLLTNAYEDALAKPRQFSLLAGPNGQRQRLPSARQVSVAMHDDQSRPHARYSLALMQFGQFGVDHDLTRTPFAVAADGSLLDCSNCDSRRQLHRDCLPIEVPAGDPHFKQARCLHFVRSLNGQPGLGPRQQVNALTSYLDGSELYGSDNCEARSLRSFLAGRLNSSGAPSAASSHAKARELMPITLANPECVTPGSRCFHAGDQRASEQPGLTAIHTIFLRLHNSVVGQLAQLNKHWNDERLYQQGRRIVGAVLQRITFHEFVPRLLGLDYMNRFELTLKQVGYSNHYDPTCSASVLNEFAAAAFRMGHSLIRASFPLLDQNYKPLGASFQLRSAFFNSQRVLTEPHLIDAILRGIVSTPIETLDNAISEELTNHLFERPKQPHSGMDLISLNIQRARDHGIPGYNKYRAFCNLTKAKNFEQLSSEIPIRLVRRLADLYASVDDIDLFTGAMSELPVHGGMVGPTLACIIGLQMSRLKRCDRFWHETSDPWLRFSESQLAEIRKLSLAKIFCQESDHITHIQRQAMDLPDQYLNPRVACHSLASMDLSPWRESAKSCLINKVRLELGQSKRINPCKSCTCTSEGPICRTAKINCVQAMKLANVNGIMADKSCLVQCAWALDMQPALAERAL